MSISRIASFHGLLLLAAAACQSKSAAAPELPADTVSERRHFAIPTSIDTTGRIDVTGPLTAFFASVPDGSTIDFTPGGTFRVEGTLLFTNRKNLTLDGNGATIVARTDGSRATPPSTLRHLWPRGRRHVMFVGGSNIVIRRLNIVGANMFAGTSDGAYDVALEAQHAFEFQAVAGVVLDSVSASDVYGDFVYLGMNAGMWTSNVEIRLSNFERSGRQGISLTGAQNVLVFANYIGDVRRSSIDIEPNSTSGGARHVTFRNNTFGPGRLLFLAAGGKAGTVDDIALEGNRLVGRSMNIVVDPPAGSRRSRFRVLNNSSDDTHGSPLALMRFTRVDSVEVRGNHQALAPLRAMTAVSAIESCGVQILGNQFVGAARDADIQLAACR